ncbi:hypothetical protein BY458DRAFT_511526 [Sporodiniella umbellata]|nr:hypothetical protein BY458DRAFT_511526 [Sporodiniella umbellata]
MSSTPSFYNLPYISNKKVKGNYNEEADTIPATTANQPNRYSSIVYNTKKSMSIQNLLDINKNSPKGPRSYTETHLTNSKSVEPLIREHYIKLPESPNQTQYNSRSLTSENQSDGYSTPPTPPSYHPYVQKHDTKFPTIVDNRLQASKYFGHFPMQPTAPEIERSCRMYPSKIEKGFSIQKRPHVGLEGHDKPLYSHVKRQQVLTNARFLNLKQDPKLRRNALQAYISYMIYADMMRPKASSTALLQVTKQHIPTTTAHNHNSIMDKPLTAFLHQSSPPLLYSKRRYY